MIQANTALSQSSLSFYEDQLNTLKANMDLFKASFFDNITDWGIYVLEVIIGFILVASLAILIGTVSTQFLDIYDCRYFIHFGWVVYGLTYFGVVFIVFLMLSYGSLGYTFCQYYSGFLTDEAQFARIGDYYSQNVLTKLDTCLYGNGDVLDKF